jgi:hypothetical protein
MEFLNEDQQAELTDHLSAVLQGDQLAVAVASIDFMLVLADSELRIEAETGWGRAERAERFRHFSALVTCATTLQALLKATRPLPGTAEISWKAFDDQLATVIEAAHIEIDAAHPTRKKGRPPEEWRDRLVSVAFSVYPAETATKAKNSHFERTIELLLGFLSQDLQDVHSVVIDALERQPKPPFTLTPNR